MPLDDIVAVRESRLMTPTRVRLSLARASALGETITFIPQREASVRPFQKSRITIRLEKRVEMRGRGGAASNDA